MHFKELYELVCQEFSRPPVRFERLRELVNAHHQNVGEIKVWAVNYPEPIHQAHFVELGTDRTSAYDEEFTIAEIRYCAGLDALPRERRFALTKELMHVFDSEDEKTNSRERFVQLANEIQNQPLAEHASPMFTSELNTKWMAVIVLCPRHIRANYLEPYRQKQLEAFEVAETLNIPEWLVRYVMDPYYDRAFEALMQKR